MGAPTQAGTAPVAGMQHAADPTMLGLSHIGRSPRWAMRARPNPPKPSDVPGPGAYGVHSPNATSRFQRGPGFPFGSAGREAIGKQKVPGPGSYSCTRGSVGSSNGRSYSMTPRRNPDTKVKTDVPGPGAHELGTRLGEGPKYSASPRVSGARAASGPGPSDYDRADHVTSMKNPRWGFGTSHRLEPVGKSQATTPGPGTYAVASSVGGGPRFSMKARPLGSRKDASPGPGAHGGHFTCFAPP
mmetsp:Transcript_140782/g.392416  ORF Transcript_140782/g.392416 Transcript_140782/m.392416 type:complete len:243 (-) Transcript_140782:273-1001(-)|eukprot:CAMPEP_0179070332 /NCGR_PEP_ID=MMETSP0796-20121207/30963_1 /TAXON_ID=73915 /ORGANISM="Pyrodinium bahamense, Strain pbaha01" /LENGTH=242 /DNA_ID=CAMNT_0020767415 /DNA_START=58 /DNA_END=786 /DNA_ORIENTATION=+